MLYEISSYLSVLNYRVSKEIIKKVLSLSEIFISNQEIKLIINFMRVILEDEYLEKIDVEFVSMGFFKSKIIFLMRGNKYKELINKVRSRMREHAVKEVGEWFAKAFDNPNL